MRFKCALEKFEMIRLARTVAPSSPLCEMKEPNEGWTQKQRAYLLVRSKRRQARSGRYHISNLRKLADRSLWLQKAVNTVPNVTETNAREEN